MCGLVNTLGVWDSMTEFAHSAKFNHVIAFERALGTGIILYSTEPINPSLQHKLRLFIDDYERVFSRFREDSIISSIAKSKNGGEFRFPCWALELFNLYDDFYDATNGTFDACVGADLLELGYDNSVQFLPETSRNKCDMRAKADSAGVSCVSGVSGVSRVADWHNWDNYKRVLPMKWSNILRDKNSTILKTNHPIQLDFGAIGKGYLVDLIMSMILESLQNKADVLIDAGGDMRVSLRDENQELKVALENPFDTTQAVGVAHVKSGSVCASSIARKRWNVTYGNESLLAHHILNAIDGIPSGKLVASWSYVSEKSCKYPTAYADALATALFISSENDLQKIAQTTRAEFAVILPNCTVKKTRAFPAHFFG